MIFKNPHIIPDLKDWPAYKLYENRDELVSNLNDFVMQKFEDTKNIEAILEKTIYREKKRVKSDPWQVDPADDKTYWHDLNKEINKAKASDNKDEELRIILSRIINRYNEEIAADFDPKTFKFFRRFLTAFHKAIYNKFGAKWFGFWGNRKLVLDKLRTVGYVDKVRTLFPKTTVVVVPTHQSNLDSAIVGFTIDSVMGLPAFVYGAGLNLYNYEFVALAINRLGTYRVDRRKSNPIYMTCLTSMLTLSLQQGCNNLFFPGGTRARHGRIEQKLKTGLLGSVVEAQRNAFINDKENKIIIVPMIMSYDFTFEAKGLIDFYLRRKYREKYIKAKNQVKISGYFPKLIKSLFTREAEYVLSVGEPMDIFGNSVDDEGNSLDDKGNILDIKGYFELNNKVNVDKQRERVYADNLAGHIAGSYLKHYVVLPSHLVAYTAMKYLIHQNQSLELIETLNLPADELSIPLEDFKVYVKRVLDILQEYHNNQKLILDDGLRSQSIDDIVNAGIKNCGAYHAVKILKIKNEVVSSDNFRMLYYYHNRLDTFEFDVTTVFK